MEAALANEVLPDYFEQLETRILHEFSEAVEAWSRSVSALSRWEQEHLLENPSESVLETHKRTVQRLIRFGRFLALTTEHPEFPDETLKNHVGATLQVLQDKVPLWHGTMSKHEAATLLKVAFPE